MIKCTLYINYDILIPRESKCCQTHLNRKNTFHKKCIKDIEIVSDYTTLDNNEVTILLDNLRHASQNTLFKKSLNIKNWMIQNASD